MAPGDLHIEYCVLEWTQGTMDDVDWVAMKPIRGVTEQNVQFRQLIRVRMRGSSHLSSEFRFMALVFGFGA